MSKLIKSRLIKEKQSSGSDSYSGNEAKQVSAPLTNALVLKYLKYCQKASLALSEQAFDDFFTLWFKAFDRDVERARSNQEAMEFSATQRNLKTKGPELKRYFCGYFSEGFVKFSKKTLDTRIDTDNEQDTNNELSLLDNQVLEETIAISSITHRADAYFSESLWALNQRLSVLNNGEPVTEVSNPVAPVQLCDALRRALRLLKVDVKIKIMAFKAFDRQIDSLVQKLLETCNNYLQQQGILPNLKYKLSSEEKDKTQDKLSNVDTSSEAFEQLKDYLGEGHEQQLIHSIRRLHKRVSEEKLISKETSSLIGDQPSIELNANVTLDPSDNSQVISDQATATAADLLKAINNLRQKTHDNMDEKISQDSIDLSKPADIDNVAAQIKENLKNSTQKTKVAQYDIQTIDLVGLLFEYMLNEEQLPDRVKTLLSHLHTPFLKIAFLDVHFFEHEEHPARLLLNALTDAGCKWIDAQSKIEFDIYNNIKLIVNRILKTQENEVKVVAECLLSFRSEIKQLTRKQELMEKRAKEKAEGEDKLRQAKQRVNTEIKRRIKDKELPSVILLFLIKVWSDYLSFVILRYGRMSKTWENALLLMDDLLWACELKNNKQEQLRQYELQAVLIDSIQKGLDSISFSKNKTENVVDALSGVFKKVNNKLEAEVALPQEREALIQQANKMAGEAVPVMEPTTVEESALIENLNMIEFGTWLEYSDGTRLKIAWYNAHTTQYMLVNQMGKRQEMITALALAREMIAQKVKVISGSAKPFFERALENILERLNAQSEQLSAGPTNE